MFRFIKFYIILLFFGTLLFAHESKLDKIIETNKLKVCIWPEYYGISYLDKRTQTIVGIDSDLAYELAKDLGVKLDDVVSFSEDQGYSPEAYYGMGGDMAISSKMATPELPMGENTVKSRVYVTYEIK